MISFIAEWVMNNSAFNISLPIFPQEQDEADKMFMD
jgi:hypothetical protein